MKTKQVPIIITLIAGLITCIIGFVMQMETGQFVKIWGIVLISFYILGCVAKLVLDHNFKEETEEATEEAAEGAEALEGEEAEAGGAVSAEEME
ncbi:MAG: hypothetical protein HFH40_03620 [Lachnospiraceae bacterium]|jgi:ABC-type bacteriocin/lantibiotic exporter with double-glycine peptidase domain|nr:hypothetical protein [Lachnospiraceae bacterium]